MSCLLEIEVVTVIFGKKQLFVTSEDPHWDLSTQKMGVEHESKDIYTRIWDTLQNKIGIILCLKLMYFMVLNGRDNEIAQSFGTLRLQP